MRRTVFTTFGVLLISGGLATGQPAGAVTVSRPPAPFAVSKSGKLSPRLATLSVGTSFSSPRAQAGSLSLPSKGAGSLVRRPGGRVLVEIRTSNTSTSAVAKLRAQGAEVVNVSPAYKTVTAAVTPATLTRLAADSAVQYVSEVLTPRISRAGALYAAGSVTPAVCAPIISEGDALMNVATGRARENLDGSGETIGILSDSFNTNTTAPTRAPADVTAGELPGAGNPCGHPTPVTVQADSPGGTDEGRGMAQLAHDLAPGAHLAFATADNGELDFANQITRLRTVNHASVIVDDVSYLDEPFFQDGPIANAAKAAVAAGVPYFSAAGNSNVIAGGNNVSSYETPLFRNMSCPTSVRAIEPLLGCHNFDPNGGADAGDDITLAPGGGFTLDLQWAQPRGAVASDYDVFVVTASGTVVGGSAFNNSGTQEPFEFFGYSNPLSSPQTVHIVVAKYSGANARFKFVFAGSQGITSVEYNASNGGDIVGPSIFGHNGASTVGSTGAIPYDDATTPEDYSSRGPVTLYYQPTPSTAALASPVVLAKPDFAATDNVRTSFFAEQVDHVWRFPGTSAAAPQAAAIGALVQEKDPAITPAELMATLAATARPVANGTPDAVGGGYLDADAALASVSALPGKPQAVSAANGDSQATVQWSAAASNPNFPVTGYTVTPILGGVPQAPVVFATPATSQVIGALTNGGSYTFTVVAVNANGTSPASDPSVAIDLGVPGAPTKPTAVAGDGQAQVTWSLRATPLTITGYALTTSDGSTESTQTLPGTATTATVTGLTNGTTYSFRVAAIDSFTTGPNSAPSAAIVVGAPGPPTAVSAAPGIGDFVITWTPPTTNNGSPVTGYVVTPYYSGVTPMPQKLVAAPATTVDMVGQFANGVPFTFTVQATNARGTGVESAPSAAVVEGTPIAPAPPIGSPGQAIVNLSWSPPAYSNGGAVTGYTIETFLGAIRIKMQDVGATPTTLVVTGLANAATYRFRVAARNGFGNGPVSGLGLPVTVGTPTAPKLTALPGSTRVTLNWTAPASTNNSAITHYIVRRSVAGTTLTTTTFGPTVRTATVTGLANGVTSTFSIVATNARGSGTAATAVVTVGAPLAPTAPTASPLSSGARIRWTAPTVTNGAAITGYVITPYRGGLAQPSQIFNNPGRDENVGGLVNGASYTFRIAARNSRGVGPLSIATAPIIAGTPTAPTQVTATAAHLSAHLHWIPGAANGFPITKFTVTPYRGATALSPRNFNATDPDPTVTGLVTGQRYTFRVSGRNAMGTGPQSLPSNAVTVT